MKGLFSYPESKDLYGIFNDSFPPILDGVTLAVENYVYWLSRKGHTPCVVTPWNPEKQDYPFEVVFIIIGTHHGAFRNECSRSERYFE